MSTQSKSIRVLLPYHLKTLAGCGSEVTLDVECPATTRTVLDALERRYPMLRGTIRDQQSGRRRPLLRFFVCEEDWSNRPDDTALPEKILTSQEPFWIVGAIAGG